MKVIVNDEVHVLSDNCSVEEVLQKLSISMPGLAVAIDNQVIPKAQWPHRKIKEDEKIMLIRATQGG